MLLAKMATGCGSTAEDREAASTSDLHFITFGPGVSGLVAKVKKPNLAVCLSGVAEGDRQQWAEEIQSVILKWVKPLRALTSVPLTQTVSVVGAGEGCDTEVVARSGTHANTSIGRRPTVNMDVDGYFASYNVLLHEFGHAFALSDTYQGGQSGNCQPGQPQAVMCNTSFSDLQKDDVTGVASVFQRTFPNDRPGSNPGTDPSDELAKMRLAMGLGAETSIDTYKIALGLTGNEIAKATAEICLGEIDECKASRSGWSTMVRLTRKDSTTIFQQAESTRVSVGLVVTTRYRTEAGLAAYQSFNVGYNGP